MYSLIRHPAPPQVDEAAAAGDNSGAARLDRLYAQLRAFVRAYAEETAGVVPHLVKEVVQGGVEGGSGSVPDRALAVFKEVLHVDLAEEDGDAMQA